MSNLILEYIESNGDLFAIVCNMADKSYAIRQIQHHDEEPSRTQIYYAVQEMQNDNGVMMKRIGSFTPMMVVDDTTPDSEAISVDAWKFIQSLILTNTISTFLSNLVQQCEMHQGANFKTHFDPKSAKEALNH